MKSPNHEEISKKKNITGWNYKTKQKKSNKMAKSINLSIIILNTSGLNVPKKKKKDMKW